MNCQEDRDGIWLQIRVKPRSHRNAIVGESAGILTVAVRAAPSDGAANRAVIAVLAEAFRCPKTSLWLARGGTSREKWIGFGGWNRAQLEEQLAKKLAQI